MALSPLAGLLGGGQPPAPAAGPPAPAGPDPDAAQDGNAITHLKNALAELRKAEQADADPSEDAAIAGVAAKLKTIIAGRAKEKDAAIGMTPALKLAQRASASGGSQGAGY